MKQDDWERPHKADFSNLSKNFVVLLVCLFFIRNDNHVPSASFRYKRKAKKRKREQSQCFQYSAALAYILSEINLRFSDNFRGKRS